MARVTLDWDLPVEGPGDAWYVGAGQFLLALPKEMATHSSILAWKILWTEEPGGLQSTGSQRVGHTEPLSTHTHVIYKDVVVPFGEFFSSQRVLCL